MDTAFLVVVAIALCLLSGGIALRLTGAGVGGRRIALSVLELWVLVVIWTAVFHTVGRSAELAGSEGMGQEARSLLSGLADAPSGLRPWIAVGLVISVALGAHLMWSLSRAKSVRLNS
jgi:hypothetical protein